jgi:hypothetical protein
MTASDDHSPLTNIGARPDPHTPGDATGPHVTRDCGQHIWPSLCGFLAGLCLLLTIISIQFVDLGVARK